MVLLLLLRLLLLLLPLLLRAVPGVRMLVAASVARCIWGWQCSLGRWLQLVVVAVRCCRLLVVTQARWGLRGPRRATGVTAESR